MSEGTTANSYSSCHFVGVGDGGGGVGGRVKKKKSGTPVVNNMPWAGGAGREGEIINAQSTEKVNSAQNNFQLSPNH